MVEQDDWEVDQTEETEEQEQDVITYQINFYPADLTLKGYLDKWNSKQLEIPPFQRSYVWDQVKASKLIESFLLGLPVPNVFLYKERTTNKLQVIDGQQRILTAIRFFKNEFDEKIFRLKNVHPRWNGRTYEQLEEADRFQLDDSVLRATVIQQLDPEDDSSVFHIFERLNTGGINLNPMEIRKCVYSGAYFALLENINTYPSWRQIVGQPKVDKRLRDAELALRVLALLDASQQYKKPMKRYLNSHLARMRKIDAIGDAGTLEQSKKEFLSLCDYVIKSLGEKPFHLRGRLNYAALDSVMIASAAAQSKGITDLKQRFERLLADKEYIEWCTKDTSDDKILTQRLERATRVLAN